MHEYKVWVDKPGNYAYDTEEDLEWVLNTLANDGWRVVGCVTKDHGFPQVILERKAAPLRSYTR